MNINILIAIAVVLALAIAVGGDYSEYVGRSQSESATADDCADGESTSRYCP